MIIMMMLWHLGKNGIVKRTNLLDEIEKNVLVFLGTGDDLAYVTNRDEKYPQLWKNENENMTLVGYEHVKMGACNGPACILNEGRKPVKAGILLWHMCGNVCVCARAVCVHALVRV